MTYPSDPIFDATNPHAMADSESAKEDDNGLGGDKEFCSHGNLIDSEDCDECAAEFLAIADAFTEAERKNKTK